MTICIHDAKSNRFAPLTWAHELGHTAGLRDRLLPTPRAIMNEEAFEWGNELDDPEAAAYYHAAR